MDIQLESEAEEEEAIHGNFYGKTSSDVRLSERKVEEVLQHSSRQRYRVAA